MKLLFLKTFGLFIFLTKILDGKPFKSKSKSKEGDNSANLKRIHLQSSIYKNWSISGLFFFIFHITMRVDT